MCTDSYICLHCSKEQQREREREREEIKPLSLKETVVMEERRLRGEYRSPEQSRLERWRGFQPGAEDRGGKEMRMSGRGRLQMFYSEGEIIAGSWFCLMLLLLTAGFRRESDFSSFLRPECS